MDAMKAASVTIAKALYESMFEDNDMIRSGSTNAKENE